MQPLFNGLITNDKLCFVQRARLTRHRARSPRLPGQRDLTAAPAYSPGDASRQGGSHAPAVAAAPAVAGGAGRATTLGSGLSAATDGDATRRVAPDQQAKRRAARSGGTACG